MGHSEIEGLSVITYIIGDIYGGFIFFINVMYWLTLISRFKWSTNVRCWELEYIYWYKLFPNFLLVWHHALIPVSTNTVTGFVFSVMIFVKMRWKITGNSVNCLKGRRRRPAWRMACRPPNWCEAGFSWNFALLCRMLCRPSDTFTVQHWFGIFHAGAWIVPLIALKITAFYIMC